MMHDYHEELPGYNADQILHDQCGECESRANGRDGGIAHLDSGNFVRAWHRAKEWNYGEASAVSAAEAPLLSVLWAVQCQLEPYGLPIGELPQSEDES